MRAAAPASAPRRCRIIAWRRSPAGRSPSRRPATNQKQSNLVRREVVEVRALIVDDSRAIRAMMGRIMRELKFDVVEASNGREALDRLQQNGVPDVALVDWNMPEMNGLEFVRAVRAEPGYRQMPLMMVTTETETENVVRALAAGANDYIMKPFDKDMIAEKLTVLGIAAG